ncbi:hypothetical protein YC2023_041256 [Brassica napus]
MRVVASMKWSDKRWSNEIWITVKIPPASSMFWVRNLSLYIGFGADLGSEALVAVRVISESERVISESERPMFSNKPMEIRANPIDLVFHGVCITQFLCYEIFLGDYRKTILSMNMLAE